MQNHIRSPRWTQPSFASPLGSLTVVVDDCFGFADRFSLRHGNTISDMEVLDREPRPEAGVVLFHLKLAGTLLTGLSDLVVVSRDKEAVSPRSVSIRTSPVDSVKMVFTSDWHLLLPGGERCHQDQSRRYFELIPKLNALSPDLVIHTGDLITRYQGSGLSPLPDADIHRQFAQAREILELLEGAGDR